MKITLLFMAAMLSACASTAERQAQFRALVDGTLKPRCIAFGVRDYTPEMSQCISQQYQIWTAQQNYNMEELQRTSQIVNQLLTPRPAPVAPSLMINCRTVYTGLGTASTVCN